MGIGTVSTHEGGGPARFEIHGEEARGVRQIFAWVGRERLTLGEVCRRVHRVGERTRTGKTAWERTTVWGMRKNPAYQGMAAFGKTRVGPLRPRLRAQRGRRLQPRRAYATYEVPCEEWMGVPVPSLVEPELFAALRGELRVSSGRLEACAARVKNGLDQADWNTRRDLMRTLVKRVEVDQQHVKVVFRVDSELFLSTPGKKSLQDCGRRGLARVSQRGTARTGRGDPASVSRSRKSGCGSLGG